MMTTGLTLAQLNGILDIADDAIICVDEKHKIIVFNQGAERIFGWNAKDILQRELTLLLPQRFQAGHDAHIAAFDKSQQKARRMGERQAIFAMRKDGTEFPAEASISKLQGENGIIHTVILRDISVRKAYERDLEIARKKAEMATQAKSLFLANMSHELRTPLNAVIGMTSLLLNTHIDDEQRDYTETIRASSEVLLTIISDVLDYSKIEIGRLEIERHPFDLRRCVEESLDLLAASASDKNINLAYLFDDGVPAVLMGDVTRLRQVLVNLLSNSIKFTHRGEVSISIGATLLGEEKYEIFFAVKDTGIGIPEERLADIFESFTQVDASTTRKYGGTGLGLAISKRLTEIMGGKMSVASVPGDGSTFSFSIMAEASGTQLAHELLRERSPALTGKRVLIVDDNSTNRRILVKQALLWGMLPSAATSAVEAMDLVRHGHAFDVAILDMTMPDIDGLELALEIRKYRDSAALPLIMLTSAANRPRDGRVAEAQFAAYLNKPIKPALLFDIFLNAMNIAPAQEQPKRTAQSKGKLADSIPLHILVAEDNTINQKVVQQLLAHLGYRADVVASGVEVLDAMERQNYDLILMDVQMPDMDGLEATRRLRSRFGVGVPPLIIAMTANAMPGDREACLAAGVDAYVSKPLELDDLRGALMAVTTAVEKEAEQASQDDIIDRRRIDQLVEVQDENNPTLLADLITLFFNDSPKHLQTIEAAIGNDDAKLLESTAHRFLSSIENLGVQRMRKPCMELERIAKAGSLEDGRALLQSLQREFDVARQHLLIGYGAGQPANSA